MVGTSRRLRECLARRTRVGTLFLFHQMSLALRVGLQANLVERLANIKRRLVALNRHSTRIEEVHVRGRHRGLELEFLEEPARRLLGLVELRAGQGRDRERDL